MDPILSLVTGTLNRPEPFKRLITSIKERTDVPWELVVSDASDPEYDYTSGHGENVHVILERPRAGCVNGYNNAFRACKGKWVIWLNDDAEVMPGYAREAIEYMERNPEIGLGALYYAEVTLPFAINTYQEMVYANFGIISKKLGDEIGWMDPIVRMYGNDNSIAFRVLLANKGIGSIPNSRIWHHSQPDKQRYENQVGREVDASRLMEKYRPYLDRMKAVYFNTLHLVGPLTLNEVY